MWNVYLLIHIYFILHAIRDRDQMVVCILYTITSVLWVPLSSMDRCTRYYLKL